MIWIGLLLVGGLGFLGGLMVGDKCGFDAAREIYKPSSERWYQQCREYGAALRLLGDKHRGRKPRRRRP